MAIAIIFFCLISLISYVQGQITTCLGFESGSSNNACTLCEHENYYSKGPYKLDSKFAAGDCTARATKADKIFYFDATSSCTTGCDATDVAKSPKTLLAALLVIEAEVTKLQKDSKVEIQIASAENYANEADLGANKEVYFFRTFQGVITIKPRECSTSITANCVTAGTKAKIHLQTDAFHFFVANSLTVENIEFHGTDLHVPEGNAFGTNTKVDCTDALMNTVPDADITKTPCALKGRKLTKPATDNKIGFFNIEPMVSDSAASYKATLVLKDIVFMHITPFRSGKGYSSIIQFYNFMSSVVQLSNVNFDQGFLTNGIIYKLSTEQPYFALQADQSKAAKKAFTADKTNPLKIAALTFSVQNFNRYGITYDTDPDMIAVSAALADIELKTTHFKTNALGKGGILNLDFSGYSADSKLLYETGEINCLSGDYIFKFTGNKFFTTKSLTFTLTENFNFGYIILNADVLIDASKVTGPKIFKTHFATVDSTTGTCKLDIKGTTFENIKTVTANQYLINSKTTVGGITSSQLVEDPKSSNKAKDEITIDGCTFKDSNILVAKNDNFIKAFYLKNSIFENIDLNIHSNTHLVFLVTENMFNVNNVNITGLKTKFGLFYISYGRNFTFDKMNIENCEFSIFIYAYVITRIEPANPIHGNIMNMNFKTINLQRAKADENIRIFSIPTYNKNFGIHMLTFDSLNFDEIINAESKDDFIIFFAAGHVRINNCVFKAIKNIGTHRFFSRLSDTTFWITNTKYYLQKYKVDSVILVTSSYYIKVLKITDTIIEGNPNEPIKDASLFEFQAVGVFEMKKVNISNVYTPKGTALSLILDKLKDITINDVHFRNNKGTANMGADMVMEIKAKEIATWESDITKITYGIQKATFEGSTSSLTLLDGGELLIYDVTFKKLNGSRGPVLNIGSSCNVYMKKFTIDEIQAASNGGAFAMSNTIFKLYDGTINNVKANNKGGIFTINKQSNIDIKNVNITKAESKYGGILFSEDSNVTINDCVFDTSKAEQEGGHFFLKTTEMTLNNVMIKNGQASTAGCIFGRFSQFKMNNVELNDCKSSEEKGVGNFYMLGLPKQTSSFTKFKCLNSIAMTGACLVVRNSNITFVDSEFKNNKATKQHIFDFSYTGPGEISFTNCQFVNNIANLTITKTKNTVLKYTNVLFKNNTVLKGDFLNQIEEQSLIVKDTTIEASLLEAKLTKLQYIFQLNDVVEVDVQNTTFNGLQKISFLTCSPCNNLKVLGSTFSNGYGLNGSVIKATTSSVNITNSKFISNYAKYSGSIYSENSNLTVLSSEFQDNTADNEGSDISIKNQDNSKGLTFSSTLVKSNFKRFNQSSIYSMNDQLSLTDVKIQEGLTTGKSNGIHIGNSYSMHLKNVQIDNMKNLGGVKVVNENSSPMNFTILNSKFINCTNDNSGGIIHAKGAITMEITDCNLERGETNNDGGGIFCDGKLCSIILKGNSSFINNTAKNIGGAIYSNKKEISIVNPPILKGNNASIGKDIYTFPSSIIVLNFTEYENTKAGCLKNGTCKISDFSSETKTFSTKSGQSIKFGVMLLDHQKNLMESEKEAILEVQGTNVTLEGFYSKVTDGLAEFPKLITVGKTGELYPLKILFRKDDILINKEIKVQIAKCGRGEYYSEQRCVNCPQSFYSLSYSPESENITECKKCEENAKCGGGQLLVPEKGYWRASVNSSLIVKCLYTGDSCPNQPETIPFAYKCASEYRGNICQNCAPKYGKTSRGCVKCSDDGLGYFLFFFKSLITLGVMVFECNIAMYIGNNLTKSLLRIIFMHNAYWIIITDGGNVNTNIADTLTSSFGFLNDHFSAAPKDVFNYYCFLADMDDTNKIFEANLVLQTVIPLIFAIATFVVKILVDLILGKLKSSTKNKTRHLLYSIFIATIISHRNWYPRILNSISSIFKCQLIGYGDKQFLTDNPDLECYSSDHTKMIAAIIVPSIIMWCITVPAIIFYFIIRNKKKTWSKRETFKTIVTRKANASAKVNPKKGPATGGNQIENEEDVSDETTTEKVTKRDSIFFYLVYDYKPHFYYWYVVEIMVVFGLSLLSQLFNEVDYTIKNMVIFVCIAILFLIYQKLQVFDLGVNNNVASLSIGVTLFSIVALLIGANEKTSDVVKQLCMVIMIILNMAFFVLCIMLIIFKKAQSYMSKFSTMFSKKKSMKSSASVAPSNTAKAKQSTSK